jgi:hypothetical protein
MGTDCRPFALAVVPGETPVQNQARMFAAQTAYIAGETFRSEQHDETTHCVQSRQSQYDARTG